MRHRQTVPVLLTLVGAGLFATAVETARSVRPMFFNSDVLLPAAWTHDVLTAPGRALSFQLPRVPSLFPDLAAQLVLALALPSWRLAYLCYGALSFVVLAFLCGRISGQFAGRPTGPSTATFTALAAIAMLADRQFDGEIGAYFLVLFPVIHSGSLLCSFAALLLVRRFAAAPRIREGVAIGVLAAVAMLSDRLFLATFLAPAVAGALFHAPRGVRPGLALAVAAVAGAGCALGAGLDHLLFADLLARQPAIPGDMTFDASHWPAMLRDPRVQVEAAFAACSVLLPLRWARGASPDARFWWAASALGSLAMLAALPVLYVNASSLRYMQPTWWWALVTLAASTVRVAPRWGTLSALSAAGVIGGAACTMRADFSDVSSIATWRSPLTACLLRLQAEGTVHAGLAGYWDARPLAAMSDWTLPVAQLTNDAKPFIWGNNRLDYVADQAGRPPAFDFVVPDGLDPASLQRRFGLPDHRVACDGTYVWTYDDPGRIGAQLRSPGGPGLLASPARFAATELSGPAGPLPQDGAVPPTTARAIASWGPYAPLRPGSWRVVARYTFAGGADPHGWETTTAPAGTVLASGPLPAGTDRLLSAVFVMPAGPHLMEFRTYTSPGDRLVLHGLGLCPAELDETACLRETIGMPPGR